MTAVIIVEPATAETVERLVRACSVESLAWRFTLPGRPDPEWVLVRYRAFLLAGTALVAKIGDAPVGLVNLVPDGDGRAELGVLVADAWHRRGIASTLVRRLVEDPCRAGWTLHASVRIGNAAAEGLLRAHGFGPVPAFERGEKEFERVLPTSMTGVMKEVVGGGIGEAGAGADGVQRRAAAADTGRRRYGPAGRGGPRERAAGLAAALLPRR
ncbi:GNAT family N-acetyltransferase [Amycolatopsis rhabdoformis]|uniref:GNAT family N-acetyltransferase n=1 Tax=Amycolatopsis rhabdoformis TaxID=1448059 RepID=A0ABZ1HWA4_9PSEU|nr:GNAT family N-acetyltransferase [Amycolatopsis rhabdoformis]WSE26512.1 GNAT family N-acetyltransferase [Amycolatopsis rhabdoformis]